MVAQSRCLEAWADRFAAYIAHELRGPITLQLALAEAALSDPHADEVTLRTMGENVVASCEQQQRLIEGLLDLTHSRPRVSCREPVDLAALTREVLREHDCDGLEREVMLAPAVVMGDPILLERLVANLVSNATRHNVPGGRIDLATGIEENRALISVSNSGPVIPAGELARLFQPFQRLRGADAVGAGLGLAIVQSIADAHDSIVNARPRPGGGLEIEVSFTRAMPNAWKIAHAVLAFANPISGAGG